MEIGVPTAVANDTFKASNLVIQGILPAAPTQLLLVGQRTAVLAAELSALNYQLTETPLCLPEVWAQHPSDTREAVLQAELSVPQDTGAVFGAAIVLDVSPQVHPLALFDQLALWLAEGAVLVLAGSRTPQPTPRVQRWLDYVVAIGARCGFAPVPMDDAAANPADGTFIRVFRKAATPRWQLRHVRAGDFAEIAELFQDVFGHPLTRGLWEWKYARGHGNAVAASRDGVMIAHYGGMYREIRLCGQPDWAYGGSDVMVHPKERGVMTRQGPFLLTAACTAEMYGPVAFGFPTERAMLVAEKMGLYTKADQMAEVRWEPGAPGLRLRTRVRPLQRADAQDWALVEGLWADMARDLQAGVVGVRDRKYLEHRYCEHPHNSYELLLVTARLTGKPLGLLALRRLEASCELLDVVAPLANLPLLIDQARRMTARWNLPHLYCWITTNHVARFVACGGMEQALNVHIPTSCWTDDPRVDMLKNRWWLMSGDTDFR